MDTHFSRETLAFFPAADTTAYYAAAVARLISPKYLHEPNSPDEIAAVPQSQSELPPKCSIVEHKIKISTG